LGGAMGYSSGRNSSSLKTPSAGASGEGCKESHLVKVSNGRTLEWTAVWTLDGHIKISQVVFMRSRRDSGQRVCHKALRFLSCGGKGGGRLSTPGEECLCSNHTP
jgi:hypothetical protein